MYDDLLGSRKKNIPENPKPQIAHSKKLYFDCGMTAMPFKVDTTSPTGKVYPKNIVEIAFTDKLPFLGSEVATTGKNLFLVNKLPLKPTIVDPLHLIGFCIGYDIDDISKEVYVNISYGKGKEDFSHFDIAPAFLGTVMPNGTVDTLLITQLYLI
ncbi:MAG: hypothetical protein HXS48_00780 [Theionarchaea archaeon]|nr:hypothetical protein [Theionarchaea archaeon]